MSKKINAPPVWREEITQYLDVLKAGGQSKGTLTTRRCQLSQMARDLQGVPADVSDDALVSWFARHEWKPETRKSYRNAVTGFFSWLHTTGRAAANPAEALPSVRRPHAHPRPCPDSVILAALGRANAAERTMIRLAAEAGLRRAEIAAVHSRDVMRDLGDGWTPHSLRHRYATATYRATNDLFLVSKLLGHDSVETTQRYVAMPEDRLRAALDDVALVI